MSEQRKKYLSKEEALTKMQRFCAYQERCHNEVRSKLIDLGVYGQTLEQIIAELVSDNFLNEERFSRSFARGKFRLKQWGRLRIINELKRRDISDYCIRKALEEIEVEDYQNTLKQVIRKRREMLSKEDNDYIRRNKVANYAIIRGFEPELVWEAIRKEDLPK